MAETPRGGDEIEASGVLRRLREQALSFRIPGVMTKLSVDEGDTVKAGQVVAALDPAGVDARLRAAAADLDRARRDVERFAPLVEKGAISREQLDNQKTALASAQAAYDNADFDRRWAVLRAPSSAVVLSRTAQAGEVLAAGQPVVTVADTSSPLAIRVPLTDRDVARVRNGMSVEVRLDALPGQVLPGRITRIGQRARSESGQVEVEATIPAAPGLRSGMLGSVRIAAVGANSRQTPYLRIPAEAVLEASGGRAAVLRIDASLHARRTAVGFGGFDGDDALVSGLGVGDRVITAGAGYVADGERVSVVDPAALGAGK
jgi:RND family efflux transporter MFP subunit